MNKFRFLTIPAAALFMAAAVSAHAGQLDRSVTKSGLIVHFGVVPAERAQAVEGSASAPAETVSAPARGSYHLVVALYDKPTGARIDDATVTAKVTRPGPKSGPKVQVKTLQPLKVNDTVTYGNYFDMPWQGRYRIDLSIKRKDSADATNVRLTYDQNF
ncbi:hypothetical protein [Paraburkholderia kururiensis]|uniref:YtkA-like domain-containing protein n=1 Tax=Paraburkholderia kururiensis TaxID=984307 RepID=A0ABZ0WHH7_9BURK|nr:hypothetical protein [Paraburkholderia kururiensis]WQD76830.1 hypothetical protein U0042_22525 [Paraburkholderia kururiensis]